MICKIKQLFTSSAVGRSLVVSRLIAIAPAYGVNELH